MAPEANYLKKRFVRCIKRQHGKKLSVWIMGFLSVQGHCFMASFTWRQREGVLKRLDWQSGHCMFTATALSFHPLLNPLTASPISLWLVCYFFDNCLPSKPPPPLTLSPLSLPLYKMTHPFPPSFFPAFVFTSANEMWDKCKLFIWLHWTWRFTFLSKARRSTLLSLCQTCCCYQPRLGRWGVFGFFFLHGKESRTGNEPIYIIHCCSTFSDHLIVLQRTGNREKTAKALYLLSAGGESKVSNVFCISSGFDWLHRCVNINVSLLLSKCVDRKPHYVRLHVFLFVGCLLARCSHWPEVHDLLCRA